MRIEIRFAGIGIFAGSTQKPLAKPQKSGFRKHRNTKKYKARALRCALRGALAPHPR